ncbi:hypothetical protein [Pullulanibacillus camelliae]|nr:hypothetical protein [Pullulanibacillus camelliae]
MKEKGVYTFAQLEEAEVNKIQELENCLGVTLIAYENNKEEIKHREGLS